MTNRTYEQAKREDLARRWQPRIDDNWYAIQATVGEPGATLCFVLAEPDDIGRHAFPEGLVDASGAFLCVYEIAGFADVYGMAVYALADETAEETAEEKADPSGRVQTAARRAYLRDVLERGKRWVQRLRRETDDAPLLLVLAYNGLSAFTLSTDGDGSIDGPVTWCAHADHMGELAAAPEGVN